jgi:hypothetical protein
MDDDGFSTSTQPLTGSKYWVIFYQDPNARAELGHGNMASIKFPPAYANYVKHSLDGYMTAEAVKIGPGDLLYVCPIWSPIPFSGVTHCHSQLPAAKHAALRSHIGALCSIGASLLPYVIAA